MKPSTRSFIKVARQLNEYSWTDFLHGYIYARWPYLYIGVGLGEHPLARVYQSVLSILPGRKKKSGIMDTIGPGMADSYHGKVLTNESARALVLVQEDVDLRDLESIIPYPKARDIVMQNPDHIVVLECPCRSARENPCLPLDVCMIVGEPFAGFILEHHPQRSRMLTQKEAVRVLEEEHERGHVHHAFFKDAMLGRFYAICNCCSCCCGAMQAMRNGSPMITASGYRAQVEASICIGCESCLDACNFQALSLVDGFASIDGVACMGCGICVDHCVEGALSLERDLSKGVPLEIVSLMAASIHSQ
jgi:ferredoxin